MLIDQALIVLKARWRRALFTFLAVVALAAAISIALPPRYDATAAVVVEMNGLDPVRGSTPATPAFAASSFTATQVDVIRSEQVALGALRRVGLDQDARWQERWRDKTGGEGSFESWLAGELLRRLDVRPARDSNVIVLTFTSTEAKLSAALVNAFVQSYIDTTLQMRAGPAKDINVFFAERAAPLRAALDQAREKLTAYEKAHGVMVGSEPDAENTRLAELNSQLVTLQDAAAEAASLRKQAHAAPGDLREVRNDPEVAALTGELVRQQGNLAELRGSFGEKHEAVIQARQGVREAQARLNAAMRRAAEALAAPERVTEARLAELREAIARQRQVVLERKSQRDAAATLVRDVDNAQRAYDAVLARASQTALDSANRTQTSISVLKEATPPPWSPKVLIRNMVVAALLGILLGISLALLAERRDRRLRAFTDVTQLLRQPLLLALPDGSDHDRSARRAEETRRRLVSMRFLPAAR
jgi:chain length determinant protein EpsF